VKQKLEEDLDAYFQYWARHLNLNKLRTGHVTGTTGPSNPDMESMKWLIAWNEGATYAQIAEYFYRQPATIIAGIHGLKKYELPIRVRKSGRRESTVSIERLAEIHAVK
jgi:UDP-3-O-[3-hydroxymyristoyl] glucosamine N-acyltransferase